MNLVISDSITAANTDDKNKWDIFKKDATTVANDSDTNEEHDTIAFIALLPGTKNSGRIIPFIKVPKKSVIP